MWIRAKAVTTTGNKTEDPSVPYAGQGYLRILNSTQKRFQSYRKMVWQYF